MNLLTKKKNGACYTCNNLNCPHALIILQKPYNVLLIHSIMGNAHDFMLEEYRQMVKIYGEYLTQENDLLKFYVAVIGVGASVITVLLKPQEIGLDLPSSAFLAGIGLLAVLISLVGSIIFFSLVGVRMEMILYVRVINVLRGYFVEKDRKEPLKISEIKKFLVLPDYDQETPPFRESYRSWFFWIVLLAAFINSVLLAGGFYVLSRIPLLIVMNRSLLLVVGLPVYQMIEMAITLCLLIFWLGIHYLFYYLIACHREEKYKVRREKPKEENQKGNV